jgi:hypothetical protein
MKRFRELVGESSMESDTPSTAARTYKEKPNKEPMAKLKEETDTSEKVEMVQSQLHFIKYACEEILEYIDDGGEVEEWYQVKVAKSFSEFESLHAYIEGESRRTGMKEETQHKVGDSVIANSKFFGKQKGVVTKIDKQSVHVKREGKKFSEKYPHDSVVKEEVEKHPFVAVHAKKGMHQTHGSTSYEAAQNAAKHWKMKNTAGIDVYRADKKHVAEETEQLDEIGNTPAGQKALTDYRDKASNDIQKINTRLATGRLKKGETVDDASRKNTNRLKGWFQADKRIKEETELQEGENEQIKGGDPCWKGYEMVGMKKKNGKKVPNCVPEEVEHLDEVMSEPNYSQSIKARQEKANKDKTPFEGSKPKKGTVTDKSGAKHGSMSRVRDLARQALKKQSQGMKPVKESLDESRKAEIVKEIIKKKKNEKTTSDEKFQKEPVLSSEITKT